MTISQDNRAVSTWSRKALCRTPGFCALLLLFLISATPLDDEPGFTPIFDGKTLDGWKAPDMSFFHIEDGAITGEVKADHMPKENQFIVWQGEPVADFELRFRFRLF